MRARWFTILIVLVLMSIGYVSAANPFFADDFESGDLSFTQNGAQWTSSTSTMVSADNARSGSSALRYRFPGGPNCTGGGQDAWAEQRFDLGRDVDELWVEFYVYYPDGTESYGGAEYKHRSQSPPVCQTGLGQTPTNNKFIRVWGDAYSHRGKVGASTWSQSMAGDDVIGPEYGPNGQGLGPAGLPQVSDWSKDFKGSWMKVGYHAKFASSESAEDGVIELFRNDEVIFSHTNLDLWDVNGKQYWNAGYLLGWANSGFDNETYVFIDDVKFYDNDPQWGSILTNLPSNYALLTELDFSQDVPPVNQNNPDWPADIAGTEWSIPYSNIEYLTKQVDNSAPSSDGDVWQVSIPAGTYGSPTSGTPFGSFTVGLSSLSPGFEQDVYVAIVSKWDDDFEWHPISNKWFQLDSPNTQMYVQSKEYETYTMPANYKTGWRPGPNPGNPPITEGKWHVHEFLLERSTGSMTIWRDGDLVVSYTGLTAEIQLDADDSWQTLAVHNFRGGGGETKTRDSFIWYDHIYIGVPDQDAQPPVCVPSTEVCNSLDDDCDGFVDEGGVCGVCSDGAVRSCGSDVGVCSVGSQFCSSGAWSTCIGGVQPVTEVCSDSLDNDCDGVVDEGCSVGLRGDFNLDGVIDFRDLVNVLSKLGRSGLVNDVADADTDGDIDLFDLVLIAKNWQRPVAPSITVSQVTDQLRVQVDVACPAESGWCQVRRVSPDPDVLIDDSAVNVKTVFDNAVLPGVTYTYNVRYWDADWGAESLQSQASITVVALSTCTPTANACDGLDNDCDGFVDEADECVVGDPVVISNGVPSGVLASGTTLSAFSVTTDVSATCKFDVSPGVPYASMSGSFWQTGGTSHVHDIGGLQDGVSYNRYVKCIDGSGNANVNDYVVSFSVASAGSCTNGATQPCVGNTVGVCSSGTETCVSGSWDGVCVGQVLPVTEVCSDSLDNDCDGFVDEGCSAAVCPNAVCEATESCSSCPSDCGVCGAAQPFWRSDLDQYATLSDVLAGPHHENFAGPGFVSVSLESGAAQPFGDKYIRQVADGVYYGRDSIVGRWAWNIPGFANNYREIWWELWFRFDDNWAGTSDHKWILTQGSGASRWSVKPGQFGKTRMRISGSGAASELTLDTDGDELESLFWDGQWHRLRAHYKMSSDDTTADGIFRVYIDGVWLEPDGLYTDDTDGFGLITDPAGVGFGSPNWGGTVDPRTGGVQTGTEWGEFAVWTSDPGGQSWLSQVPS